MGRFGLCFCLNVRRFASRLPAEWQQLYEKVPHCEGRAQNSQRSSETHFECLLCCVYSRAVGASKSRARAEQQWGREVDPPPRSEGWGRGDEYFEQ